MFLFGNTPSFLNDLNFGGVDTAVYGDSRFAGTHTNLSAYAATIENAVSPAGWAAVLTRGRLNFPADLNFAVGGDTTTDMLARLSTVCASRAVIVAMLASTNDRGSAGLTADTSIANYRTMLNALYNAKKQVHIIAELPRGDSTFTSNRLSGTQLAYHGKVRDWLLYVAPKLYPNVVVFDVYPDMAVYNSTTGDAILGMLHDGLHPATVGAYTAALKWAAYVNSVIPEPALLPSSNSNLYSATDNPKGWINSNPMMDGTAGSGGSAGTGVFATNWLLTRNSALAAGTVSGVGSKIAATNGTWQQIVFTGNTVSNSSPSATLYQDILANLNPGDYFEAFGEVEVDAGSVGLLAAQMSLLITDGTTYTSKSLDKRDSASPFISVFTTGVHRVPVTLTPPTPTQARINCAVDFAENITGVNATVRFRKCGVRKVISIV